MDKNIIKQKAEHCLNCKNPLCKKGCPLENNIPEFINRIKNAQYKQAYDILSETTIMQPICGLICPHDRQCQGSCIRGKKDKPVPIGELEAFIGKIAIENNWYKKESIARKSKKVAVVGGGPSGITCSAFLAKKGYSVTIYEKQNKLGGLLVYGIPEFRLDRNLVNNWIEQILNLGINVEYNKELGKNLSIKELKSEYEAIFISIGANKSIDLNIEGERLKGVYGANELLETNSHPNYSKKSIAVIGGGNVALDVARTVKRLGAEKVYIVYRRAEEQMPAEKKEIEQAKKEEVEFLFQNNIVEIIGNDKVKAIELIKTELVKKEGEQREVPVNIENTNYILNVDYVIKAIGSMAKKTDKYGDIELTNNGYIKINKNYHTSDKKIFAGGDIIGTRATVAWAAKSGREAAKTIEKYFSEENVN